MITIKGNEYKLKYTMRAMMIFEKVSNKQFEIKSLTDEYLYLYCMIMANNPDADITFMDLIDAMDEDPGILIEFRNVLQEYGNKQKIYLTETSDSKKNS